MKKIMIFSIILGMMLVMSISPVLATESWDVTGDWVITVNDGRYPHDYTFTMTSLPDGIFTGTGGYPASSSDYTFDEIVTDGQIIGDTISFTATYYQNEVPTGYVWHATGTIDSNGELSGTGDAGVYEWHSTSGAAKADSDGDGVLDDEDRCPGTVLDEPTKDLGTNRWRWADGNVWITKLPKGGGEGPQKSFSMEETQGCSCFQILYEMDYGEKTGHSKFGCSISVMEDFIASIQQPIFVDTVEVPSDGSTVSSVSLDDGVEYLLEASGTYRFANWGDYGIADAEWAYRNDAYKDDPLPVHEWTLGENTYPSVLGLDVLVDGGNVYWGDYNDAHTYISPYTGNGNPVSFDIYDSAYGDNSGFITVDIYKLP